MGLEHIGEMKSFYNCSIVKKFQSNFHIIYSDTNSPFPSKNFSKRKKVNPHIFIVHVARLIGKYTRISLNFVFLLKTESPLGVKSEIKCYHNTLVKLITTCKALLV